jgi:hypothetical protein
MGFHGLRYIGVRYGTVAVDVGIEFAHFVRSFELLIHIDRGGGGLKLIYM